MLWRQVVGFRRNVCELKSATERLRSAMRWTICHVMLVPVSSVGSNRFCTLCPPHRDLSDMRNELARASHSAQVSCSSLSTTLHSLEGGTALALEREKALRVQLEHQLRERVVEMMNLQTRTDAERSELNVRSVMRSVVSLDTSSWTAAVMLLIVPTFQVVRLCERRRETEGSN